MFIFLPIYSLAYGILCLSVHTTHINQFSPINLIPTENSGDSNDSKVGVVGFTTDTLLTFSLNELHCIGLIRLLSYTHTHTHTQELMSNNICWLRFICEFC